MHCESKVCLTSPCVVLDKADCDFINIEFKEQK